jgi:hypothetical protein
MPGTLRTNVTVVHMGLCLLRQVQLLQYTRKIKTFQGCLRSLIFGCMSMATNRDLDSNAGNILYNYKQTFFKR